MIEVGYRDHLVVHCKPDISIKDAIEAAKLFCHTFKVYNVIVHYELFLPYEGGIRRYQDKFIPVTKGGVQHLDFVDSDL